MSAYEMPAEPEQVSLQGRVATEIAVLLVRRSFRQADLAARLGRDQTWVSKRLTGHIKITLDDLEEIAGALDVPVEVLLPRKDSDLQPAVYQHITRTIHPARKRHLSIVGAPTRGGSDERGSATALSRTA